MTQNAENEGLREEIAALRSEVADLKRALSPTRLPVFPPVSPTVAPVYPGGPIYATSEGGTDFSKSWGPNCP